MHVSILVRGAHLKGKLNGAVKRRVEKLAKAGTEEQDRMQSVMQKHMRCATSLQEKLWQAQLAASPAPAPPAVPAAILPAPSSSGGDQVEALFILLVGSFWNLAISLYLIFTCILYESSS